MLFIKYAVIFAHTRTHIHTHTPTHAHTKHTHTHTPNTPTPHPYPHPQSHTPWECYLLDSNGLKFKERFSFGDIRASSLNDGLVVIRLPTDGPEGRVSRGTEVFPV